MKRRSFFMTAIGAAMTTRAFAKNVFIKGKDVSYEPDEPLESTGLRIKDGVDLLKKGEKDNLQVTVREEILENPNAVFFIYAGINDTQNWGDEFNSCNDQFQKLGERTGNLLFKKESSPKKGGCTFMLPNMVGGIKSQKNQNLNTGGIVHPYFTLGLSDSLHSMGNTNTAIGIRGALRHKQLVESGLLDVFNEHKLPIIEAHMQYFKDYEPSELQWFENSEGMVSRKFCTYKPVFEKDTTFINIAHAHTHKVGYTTLTMKNLQGAMPRGYGHICDSWTHLDKWRKDLMKDFNPNFRETIEKSYMKHAEMGYKYWDEGGFVKSYLSSGGYKEYKKNPEIADSRIFWAEIWAQRMMDMIAVLPKPTLNIVEGVLGRGDNGTHLSNFVTAGLNMTAVDSVTSWLMGQDPRQIPYLRIAKERGLGENDITKIPIFMVTEKGVEKLNNYNLLKRTQLGFYIYGLEDHGLRYL
jgi:uncharacterized protein (DUF362 family)